MGRKNLKGLRGILLNMVNFKFPKYHSIFLGLGTIDTEAVVKSVRKSLEKSSKRGKYKKFTDHDRYLIGKDTSFNGPASATRKWKKKYPNLIESTVRGFRKRYIGEINLARLSNTSPKKVIVNKLRGRPFNAWRA